MENLAEESTIETTPRPVVSPWVATHTAGRPLEEIEPVVITFGGERPMPPLTSYRRVVG